MKTKSLSRPYKKVSIKTKTSKPAMAPKSQGQLRKLGKR